MAKKLPGIRDFSLSKNSRSEIKMVQAIYYRGVSKEEFKSSDSAVIAVSGMRRKITLGKYAKDQYSSAYSQRFYYQYQSK